MLLCLIDGYGFVFRAYHSLPPLTRKDGTPISCVYGFCNMLSSLIENHQADYLAVVLDSGTKNFRHDLYPAYKANRPPVPDDLIIQLPLIREAIEAFNLKILEKDGYEADDLIALYAKKAAALEMDVRIISSDKDLMQLINKHITLFDPIKNIEINTDEVIKKFGIKPEQIADYLALVGDSSDNIPGAKGIGPKGAVELLSKFGSLDNIYANIHNIDKNRNQKLLLASQDVVYLSKELVNLQREYKIESDILELIVQQRNDDKLQKYLLDQGFKSLVSKIFKNNTLEPIVDAPIRNQNFTPLHTIYEIKEHISSIIYEGVVSIFYQSNVFYFSYNKHNFKINYHESSSQESLLESETVKFHDIIQVFKPIFEATYVLKILINAKSIYKMLQTFDIELRAFDDISQMSYALETGKHPCEFKDLIKEYCIHQNEEENSSTLLIIHHELQSLLFIEKKLDLYESIERPLITILAKMEIKGVKIDSKLLKTLSDEFKIRLHMLEKEIFHEVGHEFLLSSPKQLGEVLFVELGIQGGKKSKLGAFSTDASILEQLSEQGYTIADKILEWRQLSKLINTYTDTLTTFINPKTQRIHTTFMMNVTHTSRLSSRDPNLQNIPIRTEEGQKIRKAFIAGETNVMLSADYSQIELRLLAHIANIKPLQEAFINGDDIHATTASQLFNIPIAQVDAHMRRKAKTINFGIIYGISAFGLAKRLDIPQQIAKNYIEAYFIQYPGIKEYMENCIQYAKTHGFVQNLFGRKCYIKNINDRNFAIRNYAERAAINAPLQSGNADVIKKAMLKLPTEIQNYMVLQIHDELLFEIPENKAQYYSQIIKKTMEGVCTLSIPLTVELSIGKSWG